MKESAVIAGAESFARQQVLFLAILNQSNPSPTMSIGAYTPVFSFSTPGDLSVSYSIQQGQFFKIGQLVHFALNLAFTPTHSTASGGASFSLPFIIRSDVSYIPAFTVDLVTSGVTWPTGTSYMVANNIGGATDCGIRCEGNGATRASMGVTQFPSGAVRSLRISGVYMTD